MNIIRGKLIKSKNNLREIRNFVERWVFKTEEIKKISLDKKQCFFQMKKFIEEVGDLSRFTKVEYTDMPLMSQLANDFNLALQFAYGKYRKENRTFWSIFWQDKLKLPPVNFHFGNFQ